MVTVLPNRAIAPPMLDAVSGWQSSSFLAEWVMVLADSPLPSEPRVDKAPSRAWPPMVFLVLAAQYESWSIPSLYCSVYRLAPEPSSSLAPPQRDVCFRSSGGGGLAAKNAILIVRFATDWARVVRSWRRR